MSVKAIPEGFHTVTPYFTAKGVSKLIAFLREAFGAKEINCHTMPDGTIVNAEVQVGDSMIMIGESRGDQPTMKSMLYLYVPDADAVYKKAVNAGGKSILEPVDQFYGDRSGAVEDFMGNQWWIATRKENVSQEELIRRASQMKG